MVLRATDRNRTGAVAIVTGGSHGAGRAIARSLASRGWAVVVVYRSAQREAEVAVEEILDAHGTALAVRADVADDLDVERLFSETARAFGGVDAVVQAAQRGTPVVHRHAARRVRDCGAIVDVATVRAGPPILGEELKGRDITLNAVATGTAPAAAVADLVAFLVSEAGHWVDGHLIRADDGDHPHAARGAGDVQARPSSGRSVSP